MDKYKFEYSTNKYSKYAFDFVKTIIIVFIIAVIIFTMFIRDVSVVGNSMNDTLYDGDKVLMTNFMYQPKCGDIVAITAENVAEKRIIKRVIATEGQSLYIDYKKNKVYVDGVLIDESYVSSATIESENSYSVPYVIPENKLFVMGDNRMVSLDSRSSEIGLVSVDDVIGKAQFVLFPFERIKYLY